MKDFVVVVDKDDNALGQMEKMEAHETGTLHRAFSVFVFNSQSQMLIHRRAFSKYHSGGLWTNACCSHQRPGESTLDAAHRRLKEEMGFDCELEEEFKSKFQKFINPEKKGESGALVYFHGFPMIFLTRGRNELSPF